MRSVPKPAVAIVAITAAIAAFMVLSGMGPELVLVVALSGLVGVGVWFLGDLVEATPTTVTGSMTERAAPPARADRRVTRLRTGLAYGRADGVMIERLHGTLVEIIDDQLHTAHQIDRDQDPTAARTALGDELQAFIDDPNAPASLLEPKRLDRILTLIERL